MRLFLAALVQKLPYQIPAELLIPARAGSGIGDAIPPGTAPPPEIAPVK